MSNDDVGTDLETNAWDDRKINPMEDSSNGGSNNKHSFAVVVSNESNPKKVNFRAFFNSESMEDSDCVLPIASIQAVKHKFENSLVGYFMGKSVTFPLIKNYITNTWSKFGFHKVMKDDDGFFFFKFASINGVEQVLEQGPWLIRNTPLILQKWSPNMSLSKDKVTKVSVWVKLRRVPTVSYSKYGLSLIGSRIQKPIMLDAFTSSMCIDPWDRIGFACALIEVSAEADLKHEVIMTVPYEDGTGCTKDRIKVEYEWKPPLCLDCHVFGHSPVQCPKRVVDAPITVEATDANNDGFTNMTNKKRNKGKNQNGWNMKKSNGVKDQCPKHVVTPPVITSSNFVTPIVEKSNDGFQMTNTSALKKGPTNVGNTSKSTYTLNTTGNSFKNDNIITFNAYFALYDKEEDVEEDEEEKEVENVYDESANLFPNTKTDGSSYFTVVAG
uniref:DUF4283 domain-containing protein n=1 Tax=Tanacetum cinerariifolium TaxID=118510 RepID=A0A6L2N2Z2_TANCI|nr:hypothetical protein [Tanacetum cinerariifolium]